MLTLLLILAAAGAWYASRAARELLRQLPGNNEDWGF